MTSAGRSGCCGCHGNSQRVAPSPESNKEIVEIRPQRYLRIKHLNPQQRDEKFEKEMQAFLEIKKSGVIKNSVVIVNSKTEVKGLNSNGTWKQHDNGVSSSNNSDQPVAVGDQFNGAADRPRSDKIRTQSRTDKVSTPNRPLKSRASCLSEEDKSVKSSSNVVVSFDPQGKRIGIEDVSKAPVIEEKDERSASANKSYISLRNNLRRKHAEPRNLSNTHGQNGVHESNERDLIDTIESDTNDKVLFFVHGVGGSSDVWRAQIDYFSILGYEIVAPDLIGHGMSFAPDDPPAYHFNEILDDMEAIFDKYCKRKNYLIGHSYGCAFLTVIARTRSRRVQKMILISGGGPTPLAPQPGVFTLPLCLLSCIKPCISCLFKRTAVRTKDSKLIVPKSKMFDIPSYVLSYTMNGQYWLNGDEVFHSWITIHTLLVFGKEDRFVTLEEEVEMNKTIYGSSLEVVDNAGHMVMVEDPTKVNNLIHSFIENRYGEIVVPPDMDQGVEPSKEVTNQTSENMSTSQTSQHMEPNETPEDIETNETSDNLETVETSTHLEYIHTEPRVQSRLSEASLRSAKSAKSSKSMPRGLFSSRT